MASPMSNYSDTSLDFINDFDKKTNRKEKVQEYNSILGEFNDRYLRAYQLLNTYQARAYKAQSFHLGNQWSPKELTYLHDQRRAAYTYNYTHRLISLIEGIQRSNRLSTIYSSITDSAEETAEIFTDCGQYVMQNGDGYEKLSLGYKDACITGISWISPYIDYREDPINGDIKYHIDSFNATMWDPFFYERDLSDCSFFSRRKYLSRDVVMSMIPDKEEEIESLAYGTRDDKFQYMPYSRNSATNRLLNYTEYWRTVWENKDVLVDMRSGETSEWKGDKKRLQIITQLDPNIRIIKKPVRSVELGIIVEGQLLYYGKDPYGLNDYPFVPIWVSYDPSYDLWDWKLQGLVSYVMDPQTEFNKRKSKLVDIIDGQLNSGFITKEGVVTNITSLFKTGQSQIITIKKDADINNDLKKIESPTIPESQFALMDGFEKDISSILGINPEMMGFPDNENIETAAILSKMRTQAGLVGLRGITDSLSESQKILGHKTLIMIQKNYSPEKIELITKKKPTDEFYSQNWSKYNVVVQEGVLTDTQKQSEFLTLTALKNSGINIPDSLIVKKSNVHGKKELNEILDAQAKQSQETQQQQEQLEMHKLKVVSDGIESKAMSDQALAQERLATINLKNAENAERIKRAEQDSTQADLNIIKALKELLGMDPATLSNQIAMLQQLTEVHHSSAENDRAQAQHEMEMQQAQQMQQSGQMQGQSQETQV
jgi:hypothetical protein